MHSAHEPARRWLHSLPSGPGHALRLWAAWGLTIAVGAARCCAATASPADHYGRGLVWVFFDDSNLQRPSAQGVDAQVDFDTGQRVQDYSKLWLGFLQAPASGEVTFSAEADDGLRLHLGGKLVIDGWGVAKARTGRFQMKAGERVPLRLEFFQAGGTAHLRLRWNWAGQPRQVIPASAFFHSAADLARTRAFQPVPLRLPRLNRSAIYRSSQARLAGPIHLQPGPHLFLDDFLIECSSNVVRRVNMPRRDPDIPNPIVTGKADGCFQPYLTVLRDEATRRFRLWYGVRTAGFDTSRSHLGYLESENGVHWLRPHRVLEDPGPIQFGVSILDEGSAFVPLSQRFKFAWYHATGLKLATSPDGLTWTSLTPAVVLPHNHDINGLHWDPLRRRYVATVSFNLTGSSWSGSRRVTAQSVSTNLVDWSEPWIVLAPEDQRDEGQTQFYAMDGFLRRGDLILGMVKVLRDDLKADNPPVPSEAYGIGYTTLAWTRDGEHWTRDQTKFLDRNPQSGSWDHAHAWIDEQVPVGEEVFLYYAGYQSGHKVNRFEERQIGLLKMKRDRYVAREAVEGILRTPVLVLSGTQLTLNIGAPAGEVRVQVLDAEARPLPGFAFADCQPIRGDATAIPVRWSRALAEVQGKPVRLEFSLRNAGVFAFGLEE